MSEPIVSVAELYILVAIYFAPFANHCLPNLAWLAKMEMRRPTAGVGRAG
jgi:hypothetical protein